MEETRCLVSSKSIPAIPVHGDRPPACRQGDRLSRCQDLYLPHGCGELGQAPGSRARESRRRCAAQASPSRSPTSFAGTSTPSGPSLNGAGPSRRIWSTWSATRSGQANALALTTAALIEHVRSRRAAGTGPTTAMNDLIWIGVVLRAAKAIRELPVRPDIVREARGACRELRLISKPRKRSRRPTAAPDGQEGGLLLLRW